MKSRRVTVMGIFAADVSFRTERLPGWGETVMGGDFRLGPGGKGSNQAIAAARLGGEVSFISKVGADPFGELAQSVHRNAGVKLDYLFSTPDAATGAAAIIVDRASGENAIVVAPGAANTLTFSDIDSARGAIGESACFLTQFELPLPQVEYGLRLARSLGVRTILNPAPACHCGDDLLRLCDYLTPNEAEASALTGMPVDTMPQIERVAAVLLERGVQHVVMTLGSRGAFVLGPGVAEHVHAFRIDSVVDTTGAGDAFNGAFALGLAEGIALVEATRFGCAAAGLSVTRPGTAASMPDREEVERLYRGRDVASSSA